MSVEAIRNEHDADSGVHSHLGVCFRRENCRQFLITQHGDRRVRVHVPNSFPHSIQHRRPIPRHCIVHSKSVIHVETANETRAIRIHFWFLMFSFSPPRPTHGDSCDRPLKKTSRRVEDAG